MERRTVVETKITVGAGRCLRQGPRMLCRMLRNTPYSALIHAAPDAHPSRIAECNPLLRGRHVVKGTYASWHRRKNRCACDVPHVAPSFGLLPRGVRYFREDRNTTALKMIMHASSSGMRHMCRRQHAALRHEVHTPHFHISMLQHPAAWCRRKLVFPK